MCRKEICQVVSLSSSHFWRDLTLLVSYTNDARPASQLLTERSTIESHSTIKKVMRTNNTLEINQLRLVNYSFGYSLERATPMSGAKLIFGVYTALRFLRSV